MTVEPNLTSVAACNGRDGHCAAQIGADFLVGRRGFSCYLP
jgi:hypothetical protein